MNLAETTSKGTMGKTAVFRVGWVIVACLVLLFYMAALPDRYWILQTVTDSTDIVLHTLAVTDLPALAQFGLTAKGYAGIMLAVEVLFALGFASVAFFIAWRKADDPFALLTAIVLLTFAATTAPTTDALGGQSPIWYVVGEVLQAIGTGGLTVLFFLFPNGRFVPRWTRWVTVGWLLLIFVWLLLPDFPLNILNGETWRRTPAASMLFAVLFYNLCAFSQIYRYRHVADPMQKQQTKWVVVGFATGALAGYIYFSPSLFWPFLASTGVQPLLVNLVRIPLTAVFILCLPVTIAMALLRYRLWDVDIIINRTLVYGGLTLTIVGTYSLVVGGLGTLLQSRGNFVIALLTTGLIAVFFQPLLNRLQRGVNRLMFGERDDPYKVLSRLGRQLRETAVPGETLPAITQTICQTLKLPYAAIELVTADGERQKAAASGQPSTVREEWPLPYQGELVGWLIVAPRSPQERFTEQERQLLADIASQAGTAAYAVRLTSALQRSRERLVLAREEERRRIRRDLHDELGPTLASQTFKLDVILDLLETNPETAVNLLQKLKSQNQALVADIRRLVYELRPPALDELGLVAALQAHTSQLQGDVPHITIHAFPQPLPPLPAAAEVAAYRITLEAITNVVRHARARVCQVKLEIVDGKGKEIKDWRLEMSESPMSNLQSPHLRIEVQDDGVGLSDNVKAGIGLVSMRERAEEIGGVFEVGKYGGKGVRITAVLPITP